MEPKRKILIIENQITQFKDIIKLLDKFGYQSFPDEETFKEYIDWIRIYLNPRYTSDRRNQFWEKILAKTKDYNAEVIIIDHILVGSHNAEDGINLAIKFRESGITQPIIFFSRTDVNSIDICNRLPNVSGKKDWIFKGYSRADILEPSFFEKEVIPKIKNFMNPSIDLPTVVILTAIQEEYLAVKSHLKDIVDADRDDTGYEEGIFEFKGKEIAKVVIRECGANNTNASVQTERAIQYFKPKAMFFVGIAGSRKPNDFGVGDVIFPLSVLSYEGGKSGKESFSARPDGVYMSFTLMEKAKKERSREDWKTLIKGKWQHEVKADLGIIASGEKLIEHYDSHIGQIITEHYNQTHAVEMEGFGFAKAAISQGRETSNMLIGVVRGISDILGQTSKEEEPTEIDRRPADAKKIASDTAAAFAFWLIFKTYEQNPMK
jgi:nucleoside phosphorylase